MQPAQRADGGGMQTQQQSPSPQRRPHVAATAADVDGAGPSCRICLDPCLLDADTVKLGCRCSASGFDVMHRVCAAQWFGPRKSTTCEVCSAEAVGLPLEIKAQIRLSQLSNTPQQRPLAGLRAFTSVPAFLACYLVFCLMPAAIVSVSLAYFFINVLSADIVTGMSLSVALATSTIIHWLCFPQRPLLHACFVVATLGCSLAFALLAATAFPSWGIEMQLVLGSVSGFVVGSLIFYCFCLPLGTLLVRCYHSQGALYQCCIHCGCACWRPRGGRRMETAGAASVDIERAGGFSRSRSDGARVVQHSQPAVSPSSPVLSSTYAQQHEALSGVSDDADGHRQAPPTADQRPEQHV